MFELYIVPKRNARKCGRILHFGSRFRKVDARLPGKGNSNLTPRPCRSNVSKPRLGGPTRLGSASANPKGGADPGSALDREKAVLIERLRSMGSAASGGQARSFRYQLPWREAGPPHPHDGKVDSDLKVVRKEVSSLI